MDYEHERAARRERIDRIVAAALTGKFIDHRGYPTQIIEVIDIDGMGAMLLLDTGDGDAAITQIDLSDFDFFATKENCDNADKEIA